MLSIRPISARLLARVRGKPDFRGDAHETLELCPADIQHIAPPLHLPNERERIVRYAGFSTLDQQARWLEACELPAEATRLHRMADVMLVDGALFTASNALHLRDERGRALVRWLDVDRDEAMLVSDYAIERYFGHWITDGLDVEAIAADRQLAAIVPKRTPWPHVPGYRALLGDAGPQMVETGRFGSLWVADDIGLNAYRSERARRGSARLRSHAAPGGPRRVFLHRGTSGVARALANEAEVTQVLARHDFAMLSPEQCEPRTIVDTLAHAEIVVGVEGSAMNHAYLAAPPGSTILIIQPPTRFNAVGRPLMAMFGHQCAYVVADVAEGDSFTLSPDHLLRTIELAETARARRAA